MGLASYDVAVRERIKVSKEIEGKKAQDKVKLSEKDILEMNKGIGVGVSLPECMFTKHAKIQRIHNDFLQKNALWRSWTDGQHSITLNRRKR